MNERDIIIFTANESDLFIRHVIGDNEYKNLSRKEKDVIRCANILIEYQLTGTISYRILDKQELLHGNIGRDIQSYLDYRKSIGISPNTICDNRIYLGRFKKYLDSVGRSNFTELTKFWLEFRLVALHPFSDLRQLSASPCIPHEIQRSRSKHQFAPPDHHAAALI